MLPCYNRGCGKDYDPENNPDGEFKLHFFKSNSNFFSLRINILNSEKKNIRFFDFFPFFV